MRLLRLLLACLVSTADAQAWLNGNVGSPFNLLANLSDWAQPITPYDFTTDGPGLELVHEIYGDFPTGVAVDKHNRLFFNIPRSATNTSRTVALATSFTEEEPWPNQRIQHCTPGQNVSTCFVNVQNVVIDSTQERIWVLDTGVLPGQHVALKYGAKVWSFDLTSRRPLRNYVLPRELTAGGMNINDIRFNLSLSDAGVGFLTDEQGSLVTLDLHSGMFKRRLFNETATTPDAGFVGSYNGEPFYEWAGTQRTNLAIGADGIALASGNVYFAPLASRRLYQVPQRALADSSLSDADLLRQVEFIGQIGAFSQGFTADDKGRVYIGTAEQNSISYFNTTLASVTRDTTLNGLPAGKQSGTIPAKDILVQPFVRSAFIQWPDSMCVENGYLWFTTNQLPLMPSYRRGNVDLRKKPFKIYRAFIGAGPAV